DLSSNAEGETEAGREPRAVSRVRYGDRWHSGSDRMNTEIGPEVDLALRKQIERAVRPVQAGKDRKLAMREELLAHLTAIYTEERERQPDDQAAMAAALERFGEPAALTTELNASVGSAARIGFYVDGGEDWFNGGLRYWFSRR